MKHDRRDPGYWLRLCLFGDRVFAHWFANEQGGRGKSGGSATELLWSAATLFYEALNDVIGSLDHLEGLPHERKNKAPDEGVAQTARQIEYRLSSLYKGVTKDVYRGAWKTMLSVLVGLQERSFGTG